MTVEQAMAVVLDANLTARERVTARTRFLATLETAQQVHEAWTVLTTAARERMDAGDSAGFNTLTDFANFAAGRSPVRRRNAERRARNAYRF